MKSEKVKKFFTSRAGRSTIVIASVLVIGLAVYLNYRWFYDPTSSLGYGENNMEDNYGDSQQAGTDADTKEDYFAAVSLSRSQSRDEAIEVLKLVVENGEATEEAKAEAAERISQIALDIQNEANIETLVKAKGFEECVAVISEDSVSVVVSAENLQATEVAQIMSIVFETTGVSPEKVSVVQK